MAKVIIHIGAHGLFRSAMKLATTLAPGDLRGAGVSIISLGTYRRLLRQAVEAGNGTQGHGDILAARASPCVSDLKHRKTYVLSNDRLLSSDKRILGRGVLYPEATRRVANLLAIYSDHEVHFKVFICDFDTFAARNDLPGSARKDALPWTNLVARIVDGAGHAPVSVWGVRPTARMKEVLPAALLGEETTAGMKLKSILASEFEMTATSLGGVVGEDPSDIEDDHFREELRNISRIPDVTVYEA